MFRQKYSNRSHEVNIPIRKRSIAYHIDIKVFHTNVILPFQSSETEDTFNNTQNNININTYIVFIH